MRYLIIIIFCLNFCLGLHAQHLVPVIAQGVAECGYTHTASQSLLLNPAGLGELSSFGLLASANQRYFSEGVLELGLSAGIPIGNNTGGSIHLKRFGDDIFSEQSFGLSIGKRLFEHFALGITMDYYQLSIDAYGSKSGFNTQIGFQGVISPKIRVSSFLFLPLQKEEEISNSNQTTLHFDLNIKASKKVNLYGGLRKLSDYDPGIKAAIEYRALDYLKFQTGIITNPTLYSFGAAVVLNDQLDIQLTSLYQPDLGWSAGLGLLYKSINTKE